MKFFEKKYILRVISQNKHNIYIKIIIYFLKWHVQNVKNNSY